MNTLTIVPPPELPSMDGDGDDSERERLLAMWRLYPEALVDLIASEVDGGPDDGSGLLEMSDERGDLIEEFRFSDTEAADEAVLYALRQLTPGAET